MIGSGKSQLTFNQVPLEQATIFAAEEADALLQVYARIKPRLAAEHMVTVYETLERPLVPVLEKMERIGVKVDAVKLKGLSEA